MVYSRTSNVLAENVQNYLNKEAERTAVVAECKINEWGNMDSVKREAGRTSRTKRKVTSNRKLMILKETVRIKTRKTGKGA
jgi:hypothetical protein